MKRLIPMPAFSAQPKSWMPRFPLCETKAILPAGGVVGDPMAKRLLLGQAMPMQFGPITRMSNSAACSIRSCCSFSPSAPVSLKLAEMITAFFTFFSPQSRMTAGTAGAGTATRTRSISSSRSRIDLWAGWPSTIDALWLIRWMRPPKPLVIRLRGRMKPHLPGMLDAPITATDRGLNRVS